MVKLYLRKIIFLFIFIIPVHELYAQFKWQVKPSDQKVFIENKGQYYSESNSQRPEFGCQQGNTQILFSKNGLDFKLSALKYPKQTEEETKPELVSSEFSMRWMNPSPDVKIIASNRDSAYFNFGLKDGSYVDHVNGYNKILYLNIYPFIDCEYVFHPETGIEYSFTLHPGADPQNIQLSYSGNVRISRQKNGEILFETSAGSILEHLPKTFYSQGEESIFSNTILNNNLISFKLDTYDKTKSVTIDPWMAPLTTMIKGYDIEMDRAGNAYVFGGNAIPYTLEKYNSTGVRQWSYSPAFGSWYGDLAVDRSGNCYISEGCCTGKIEKINSSGVRQWGTWVGNYELWSLAFNCGSSQLSAASYTGGQIRLNTVNTTTGMVTFSNVLSTNEVRSMNVAPNGKLYSVTADFLSSGGAGNFLVGRTATFGPMFNVPSGYLMAETSPAFNSAQFGGMNLVTANNCRVYTTDGVTLKKWDATTGAMLGSIAIPGGAGGATNMLNAGIAVDSCENIFVGSGSAVVQFTPSLTPVNVIPTPGSVFCVNIGYNGDILVSGQNFAGAFAANACQVLPCATSITAKATGNKGTCKSDGTATASTIGGTAPFTYTWSTVPVQTSAIATGLNPGTYTVTITQACGPKATASVTIPTCAAVNLDILSFQYKLNEDKQVMLNWKLSPAIAGENWVLERSKDGTAFVPIKEHFKIGNPENTEDNNSFTDKKPEKGLSYYRLKVSKNEKTYSSDLLEVNLKPVKEISINPNPVTYGEDIDLNVVTLNGGKCDISLFDGVGKILFEGSYFIEEGQKKIQVPGKNLEKGLYYITFKKEDQKEYLKLIIQ